MALRRVELAGLEPVEPKNSVKPELGFVDIDQLVIDEAYQRSIETSGLRNIQKIADNFDWSKFSPLMVARRDDQLFAIIDGQHRAHAAALCGFEKVPAQIARLTLEEQAAAFSWINGSVTSLSANQIFKAALAAYEPWAVQCDAIVTRAGCELMTHKANTNSQRPKQVYPISTVRKIVENGDAIYLVAVLRGVAESSVRNDFRYYNAFGIQALVPAAIAAGVTQPFIIRDFLNAHDLDDTAKRVRVLLDKPEHRLSSFKSLFHPSVAVLLKNFVGMPISSGAK